MLVAGCLVILIAVVAWPLYSFLRVANVLVPVSMKNADPAKCRNFYPPSPSSSVDWHCEDLAVHHGGHEHADIVILSCGDRQTMKHWFPNRANFDKGYPAVVASSFFLFDTKTKTFTKVSLEMAADDVHLLGISYDQDSGILMAVNNLRHSPSPAIDMFQVDIGRAVFTFTQRFQHKLISTPNNLQIYKQYGFFVTNDHGYRGGWLRALEEFSLRQWGSLVYCSIKPRLSCKTIDTLAYPNGLGLILKNNAADRLLVASTAEAAVYSYSVTEKNGKVTARRSTVTQLDFVPDNIIVKHHAGKDDEIYVAGMPKLLSYIASTFDLHINPNPIIEFVKLLRDFGIISRKSWSKVVQLKPHDTEWFMGDRLQSKDLFVDNGDIVEGSSSAVLLRNELYIGAIVSTGLTVCLIAPFEK